MKEKNVSQFLSPGKVVIEKEVSQEVSASYLEYAYAVVHDRALPDARDGLKPVHRRILYTMHMSGLTPDHAHVKSARVVGECFVAGTLVCTPGGMRPIEELEVGDEVFDGWGRVTQVVERYHNEADTLVKVTWEDGRSLLVTPGQLFRVDRDSGDDAGTRHGNGVAWVRADALAGHRTLTVSLLSAPAPSVLRPEVEMRTVLSGEWVAGQCRYVAEVGMAASVRVVNVEKVDDGDTFDIQVASPDHSFVAESFVVHNCLGRYHPHGDSSVYEAMVRLAQDFSLNTPLVDGHGNFGSPNDAAAASRYCVTGDTLVPYHTTHPSNARVPAKVAPIREIADVAPHSEVPVDIWVYDHKGQFVRATTLFNSGPQRIYTLRTRNGSTLRGSSNHLVLCLVMIGDTVPMFQWYRLDELTPGMVVCTVSEDATPKDLWSCRRYGIANNLEEVFPAVKYRHLYGTDAWSLTAQVARQPYIFTEVDTVECDGSAEDVYSLKVDSEAHSFLAGGFINHNTEARMSPYAMMMVKELHEDTVAMVPNYDGSLTEPEVLPASFPNLLVNGSSGIAVGMATNMIPHNAGETLDAARALLRNPDVTLDELMTHLPGPDLPTGGVLIGMDEVRAAYETGRGTVRVRGRTSIEPIPGSRGRNSIVITELPYQVGTEKIIESIKKEVDKKRLLGISDVKDLTDRRNGTRLVVECKTGVNATVLLNELYKYTPLETSFGINNLTLVRGTPQTLGVKDLLAVFLRHREDTILRRTRYRLAKAEARQHIVEGFLIALDNINTVVRIIRGSKDTAEAKQKLIAKFKLTDIQTQHILDMPLRRLVNLEVTALQKEHKELTVAITGFRAILDDPKVLHKTIDKELVAARTVFTQPRRTQLMDGDLKEVLAVAAEMNSPVEVPDEPCHLYLSAGGTLIRTAGASEDIAHVKRSRNTHRSHMTFISDIPSTTLSNFILITNLGRAFRVNTMEVPPAAPTKRTAPLSAAAGVHVSELLPALNPHEHALILAPSNPDTPGRGVAIGTQRGVIKICAPDWPARADEWNVIALKPGDAVIGGGWCHDDDTIAFLTSGGNLLHFPTANVRPQGRNGAGMAGIKLPPDTTAITCNVVHHAMFTASIVITHTGTTTKTTLLSTYPGKGRGTGGVRAHKFLAGETHLSHATITPRPVAATKEGKDVPLTHTVGKRDAAGKPTPPLHNIGTGHLLTPHPTP